MKTALEYFREHSPNSEDVMPYVAISQTDYEAIQADARTDLAQRLDGLSEKWERVKVAKREYAAQVFSKLGYNEDTVATAETYANAVEECRRELMEVVKSSSYEPPTRHEPT